MEAGLKPRDVANIESDYRQFWRRCSATLPLGAGGTNIGTTMCSRFLNSEVLGGFVTLEVLLQR
jgi:hypothetical protein